MSAISVMLSCRTVPLLHGSLDIVPSRMDGSSANAAKNLARGDIPPFFSTCGLVGGFAFERFEPVPYEMQSSKPCSCSAASRLSFQC
jgi:hypothetical protein